MPTKIFKPSLNPNHHFSYYNLNKKYSNKCYDCNFIKMKIKVYLFGFNSEW